MYFEKYFAFRVGLVILFSGIYCVAMSAIGGENYSILLGKESNIQISIYEGHVSAFYEPTTLKGINIRGLFGIRRARNGIASGFEFATQDLLKDGHNFMLLRVPVWFIIALGLLFLIFGLIPCW